MPNKGIMGRAAGSVLLSSANIQGRRGKGRWSKEEIAEEGKRETESTNRKKKGKRDKGLGW